MSSLCYLIIHNKINFNNIKRLQWVYRLIRLNKLKHTDTDLKLGNKFSRLNGSDKFGRSPLILTELSGRGIWGYTAAILSRTLLSDFTKTSLSRTNSLIYSFNLFMSDHDIADKFSKNVY